jgi:hypothetical protein
MRRFGKLLVRVGAEPVGDLRGGVTGRTWQTASSIDGRRWRIVQTDPNVTITPFGNWGGSPGLPKTGAHGASLSHPLSWLHFSSFFFSKSNDR